MVRLLWRWTTRALLIVTALLIVAAVAGATYEWSAARRDMAAVPPPGRLIEVGGHRLHLWCTGSGAPAVILDAGLGGSSTAWGYVQPEIARFTQACSYDRAWTGYSDAGPSPRTSRRIAQELAVLLERGGITGPGVFVGASIGGYWGRVLASEHPNSVTGLVLVDASHEDQQHDIPMLARYVPVLSTLGIFRLLGVSFGHSPDGLAPDVRPYAQATRFRAAGYRAAANEIIHIKESAEEVRATRRRLSIPVVVVTGAHGNEGTWRDLQLDQVRLSERGCQMIAENSGHAVPIQQPEVVVAAIRATVDAVRTRSADPPCPPPT